MYTVRQLNLAVVMLVKTKVSLETYILDNIFDLCFFAQKLYSCLK